MKYALLFILIAILSSFSMKPRVVRETLRDAYVSPLKEYSDEWNDPKYAVCNTARNANYMTSKEKEVIHILNLARMNPKLFCSTVLKTDTYEAENEYYTSLAETLEKMTPVDILQPNKESFQSAQCHAISSGKLGYVGHTRQSANCKRLAHFYGECCSYGETDAIGVVMQLLIDEGVPSYGHREICLSDAYLSIGVSIQPHKQYGMTAVLDFYY
jgi:uncharacterized protein YkwD